MSGLVAAEVGKHHSAFSLLGSEVERMRQRLQTSEADICVMKGAIDRVIEEIQLWEGTAQETATSTLPPGIDLRGLAPPRSAGMIGAPKVDSHGMSVPDVVGMADAGAAPAWDPWKRAAQGQPQGVTQGALGLAPASSVMAATGPTTVKFSEKVATLPSYQYDGRQGGFNWHKKVKNYLISQSPEIELILREVEASDDGVATSRELVLRPGLRVLSLGQVEAASNALWAFLILCLTGDARYAVDNAGPREGFEVWRRLL